MRLLTSVDSSRTMPTRSGHSWSLTQRAYVVSDRAAAHWDNSREKLAFGLATTHCIPRHHAVVVVRRARLVLGWVTVYRRHQLSCPVRALAIMLPRSVHFDQRYNKTNSYWHHRSIVRLISLSCGNIARVPSALGQYSATSGNKPHY